MSFPCSPAKAGIQASKPDGLVLSQEHKAVRFAGYAAVFDRVDRGGDVVRKGAFGRLPRDVPLLWQHEAGRVVGRVEYLREDKRGLRVIGRVLDKRAAELVGAGSVKGLSFGYRVREARGTGPRELTRLELVEVSLVSFPMQPLARVHAVEITGRTAKLGRCEPQSP